MEEELELKENEQGITLKELFSILWKNIVLIIVIVAIFLGGGLVYALTQKPTYTLSKSVVVACIAKSSNGTTSDYNDFNLTKASLPTLAKYFVSDEKIYNLSKENLNKTNNGTISVKNIHIDYKTDIAILTFSYTDKTIELAKAKLDAYLSASKQVVEEVDSEGKPINFVYAVKLQILQDNAALKVNSHKKITVLVAGLIGIIVAVLIVLIKYWLDDTIKSKDELEKLTGVKLFAHLEEINDEMINKGGKNENIQ